MNRRNPFILLLLVALLGISGPGALLGEVGPGPSDDQGPSRADACCGEGVESDGSPVETDDCCPTGCTQCYLACCGGMVPLLPLVVAIASTQEPTAYLGHYHGNPSPSFDREIDHPPRA